MAWAGVLYRHFLGCLESIPVLLSWYGYKMIYLIRNIRFAITLRQFPYWSYFFHFKPCVDGNGNGDAEICWCRYCNAFELRTVARQLQSRSYIFCAETVDERNKWIAAISKVCWHRVIVHTVSFTVHCFLCTTSRSAKPVLAIVILSVCLSLCLYVHPSVITQYQTKSRLDRNFGFSPYDSVSSFFVTKFYPATWRDSPQRRRVSKFGTPLRNHYFTAINSSSVRTYC